MQEPTQEEKNQAMENMECWKTQEHLKECRKCAPVGNWLQIEDEFRKKFYRYENEDTKDNVLVEEYGGDILKFFKPYFQEILHDKVVEALEKPELFSYDDNYLKKEKFDFEVNISPKEDEYEIVDNQSTKIDS